MIFDVFARKLRQQIRLFQWNGIWYNLDSVVKIEWDDYEQYARIHLDAVKIYLREQEFKDFLKAIGGY